MNRIKLAALLSCTQFALRNTLVVSLLFISFPGSNALGHDSLYNYVEAHLLEDGSLEVTFSVHAADLVDSPDVDPSSTDTSWYASLTTSEQSALCERANQFLKESYLLHAGKSVIPPAIQLPSVTKSSSLDTGPRPGCLLATLQFARCPESLSLNYEATGKRLMLVVTRPGAFPKVHDVEPGGSHILQFNTQ